MAAAPDILPPRYRDPTKIGAGGMALVYRALDTSLDRTVAIKILDRGHADDSGLRARFTREALAAARLSDHPHVVTIFDVGEWRGRPYIVMEYLDGGSLAGRGPDPRTLDWIAQAASALDAAHAAGVVHRDVKPANLLLDSEGTLKVADFGIASATGSASLTSTGMVLGTAGYLAPEQARGERATSATDLYALAVVAHELLTGAGPGAAPPPAGLEGVFARALAEDPAARQATAAGLVRELRNGLDSGEPPTRALGPPTVVLPRHARRRRPLFLAGILAAAAAGAAIAVAVTDRGHESAASPPLPRTHTVTAPGTTLRETVTAEIRAQTPPPAADGHALNDQGYARLQSGDAAGALPLLQQAVRRLAGTGPADPYEAYANYNLGIALLDLGRCAEAVPYLDRAARLEPDRHEPRDALHRARDCAKVKPHDEPKPPKHHGH